MHRKSNWYGRLLAAVAFLGAVAAAPAHAQTITVEQARTLTAAFYDMLNQPATKDLKTLAEAVIAPDWKSYSSETEFKGREAFVGQVAGFGKAIPDLKWEIKELFVSGDRIIVRGEASGTPAAQIFGVPPAGKSFRIMSIDIHTVRGGKLAAAHHVEDWTGAIRQLTAKPQ